MRTEITKSHLSNRQHCGVKTSTVTPSFYYVFKISLSCNINIPSFIENLWWDLLLGNHLNAAKCSINYSKLPSSLGRLDGPHSVLFLRDHACLNRIALIVLLRVLLPTAVLLFSRIDNCTIIVQSSGSELYLRISFPVTVDPKSSMIFLVLAILISKRYCSSGSRSS